MTTVLLRDLGIEPAYPQAQIINTVAMEMLVVALVVEFFLALRATLSVDKPSRLQHLFEMAQDFVGEQAHGVIGHDYQRYVPYAMAVGLFILFSNLLGLIPAFASPTASLSIPLACAIFTFLYYQFQWIRHHKFHYYKQFVGPVWPLAP